MYIKQAYTCVYSGLWHVQPCILYALLLSVRNIREKEIIFISYYITILYYCYTNISPKLKIKYEYTISNVMKCYANKTVRNMCWNSDTFLRTFFIWQHTVYCSGLFSSVCSNCCILVSLSTICFHICIPARVNYNSSHNIMIVLNSRSSSFTSL